MPMIEINLSIGISSAKQTDEVWIDDKEWEEMTEEERGDYLDQLANDFGSNYIDLCAYVKGN